MVCFVIFFIKRVLKSEVKTAVLLLSGIKLYLKVTNAPPVYQSPPPRLWVSIIFIFFAWANFSFLQSFSPTKPSPASLSVRVTGDDEEEAAGEEKEEPPPPLVLPQLSPFYIMRMQIFKASRSGKRGTVAMVEGLKADPSLTDRPPPPLPRLSEALCSSSCCIRTSSACRRVMKGRRAELCFEANAVQTEVCLLWRPQWMSHMEAEPQPAFHFQYLSPFVSKPGYVLAAFQQTFASFSFPPEGNSQRRGCSSVQSTLGGSGYSILSF